MGSVVGIRLSNIHGYIHRAGWYAHMDISVDISMDIHIHGNPDFYLQGSLISVKRANICTLSWSWLREFSVYRHLFDMVFVYLKQHILCIVCISVRLYCWMARVSLTHLAFRLMMYIRVSIYISSFYTCVAVREMRCNLFTRSQCEHWPSSFCTSPTDGAEWSPLLRGWPARI